MGGNALCQRLIQIASRDANFPEAILLLPAFPGKNTRSFLKRLRSIPSSAAFTLDEFSPRASRAFVADIALAETGDDASEGRLQRAFRKNRVIERVWLCHALPFIHNRRVLRMVTPLLNDSRVAQVRFAYVMQKQGDKVVCIKKDLPPLRVCDVAARALLLRKSGNRYGDLYEGGPVTADELKRLRAEVA